MLTKIKELTGLEDNLSVLVALIVGTFIAITLIPFCVAVIANPYLVQGANF